MNSIENVLKISMEHARNIVDANTIIGTPFELSDGTYIIPVSKLGMGLISGGADIPTNAAKHDGYPFAGTSAVGMGLTPVSFIVHQKDSVRIMPVDYESPLDRLIDTMLPLVEKIAQGMESRTQRSGL